MPESRHYVVQLGSGKPGELGTEETEYAVFDKIGLKNPKITFIPFHVLNHQESNDYTEFVRLVSKVTNVRPYLVELDKSRSLKHLEEVIMNSDLVVLGSGLCEPYLRKMYREQLDWLLKNFFKKGGSLIGYSAGSIALNGYYVHVVLYYELFLQWQMMTRQGLPGDLLKEHRASLLSFVDPEFEEEAERVLKAVEQGEKCSSHIFHEIFEIIRMPGLGFLPELALLPHYKESPHATDMHLIYASRAYPKLHHFGVPNGVALFHTFQGGKHFRSEIMGKNPNTELLATRYYPLGRAYLKEGDVFFYPKGSQLSHF
jgi:hypothetical protein